LESNVIGNIMTKLATTATTTLTSSTFQPLNYRISYSTVGMTAANATAGT